VTAPQEPPQEPPPPRLSWGARLGLLFGILSGPAYIAWIAGVEGKRIWVILGIILLIAGGAGLAHRLMAMTRK